MSKRVDQTLECRDRQEDSGRSNEAVVKRIHARLCLRSGGVKIQKST